jgi:hypothetical protein
MELTCLLPNREVYLDGHLLDPKPSQKRHNHSPDGFMWGYHGSGPAQLALAVMMAMFEGTEFAPDFNRTGKVKKHYQDFKRDVIANLPMDKSVALEFDFWDWYRGKPAEECIRLLKILDMPQEKETDARHGKCTPGHETKCAYAGSPGCDCQCAGVNHGKLVQGKFI